MYETPEQSEVKHNVNEINTWLVGARIVGSIATPDGESFGLQVITKTGITLFVWVQQDAEGNGPGWLAIENENGGRP